MPLRSAWRESLNRLEPSVELEAVKRADQFRELPVDLIRLSRDLNTTVILRESWTGSREHGALERTNSGYRVLVPAVRGGSLTGRQRFTIAHELAHVLFLERGLEPPVGPSEYWRLEESCNRIAGKLLVPRWMAPTVDVHPAETADWLTAFSVRAGVSLEAAAKEFVLSAPNALATVGLAERNEGGVVVRWALNTRHEFPLPARGTHLDRSTLFGSLFYEAGDSSRGVVRELAANPTIVGASQMYSGSVVVCLFRPVRAPEGQLSLLDAIS